MSWKAFWVVTAVYLLMIVAAWCSRDGMLACVAAFLVGFQLLDNVEGRPWH